MTATTLHPLAADYLERLRDAARSLPRGRRDDLLADIESHLAESAPAGASEAEVRTALDRLGDPDQIVAAERDDDNEPKRRRGGLEWAAIILLLIGGIVIPFVGWIVGALLLWVSHAWTLRDKLIGTLVLPGGLLAAVVLVVELAAGAVQVCRSPGVNGAGQTCTGGVSDAHKILLFGLFVAAVVLPFVTAVYLARRAHQDG
jgi:uncharacterized membrane protein